MNRVLLAIAALLGAALPAAVARAQPATPLPPPPPPPLADAETAPPVVPARPPPPPPAPLPRRGHAPAPAPSPPPPTWSNVEERRPRRAENLLFVEAGGNGIFYSIDYERLLGDSFSLRAGLGFVRLKPATVTASLFTVPLLGNYYAGGREHKLQLGAGMTLISMSGNQKDAVVGVTGVVVAPTFAVGYRYLPARGGFTFFAGLTPLIVPGRTNGAFLPWAGISVGWAF
jgi:hypothetical protein